MAKISNVMLDAAPKGQRRRVCEQFLWRKVACHSPATFVLGRRVGNGKERQML
jgi:hypothetical protein